MTGARPAWLWACALLAAVAANADPAAPSDEVPAQLDLLVNDAPMITATVLLRSGDVLIAPDDLAQAGLDPARGQRVRVDGREYVSLRSLGPDVQYRVDEAALALRMSVPPALLGKSVVDLRPSVRPAGLVLHRDTSAFANYSVQADVGGGVATFLEAGASLRGALLYSGASRAVDGTVTRGLSSLTYDQPGELRRWVLGDSVASGSVLGGGGVLAGFSVSREFALDPYFIRGPLPRLQGFALTPSKVDVYVNGVLLRQEAIKAGQFDLMNLPLDTGDGAYRAVIRDAFGREQEVSGRYYFSSGLLAKGLTDYSYQLGAQRNGFGSQSWDYGAPAFLARHRIGLFDSLTAGARVEGTRGVVSGGPTLTVGLPFGEMELAAAASGGRGGAGGAASLSYSYVSRRFSIGALARLMSDTYANLSLRDGDDRPRLQANLFAGLPVANRFSLNAELQLQQMRDAGSVQRMGLRADAQVGSASTVSISLGRLESGGSGSLDAYVMVTHAFGARTMASASAVQRDGAAGTSVVAQQSAPAGQGFGYRVAGDTVGPSSSFDALAQYQASTGIYQAEYRRIGPQNAGSLQASGGVVAMGGDLFLTRPVQDGYALVQVPGVGGVRGFLNNQEIGRTNGRGNLLVPGLSSYYGNKISIAGTDLPLDYDVGKTEELVATSLRGGAAVRFEVRRVQAVTGQIETEGGAVPAFGELQIDGKDARTSSPVSADGRFWLEGLGPGSYAGAVEFGGGTCKVTLQVPASTERALDLGKLRCSLAHRVAAR